MFTRQDILKTILSVSLIAGPSAVSLAATTTWTGAINTDWFNAGNWDNGVPGNGTNAVIASGTVSLTNDTAFLASFTMNGGTLTCSNWTTKLIATNVVIDGGTITLPAAFTNGGMSNRIWIVCSNDFTLDVGGTINANIAGYKGGSNSAGHGTGGGAQCGSGGGAGYGGVGADASVGISGGASYGSSNAPVEPGSGGAGSIYQTQRGGAGGGAVRIQAAGKATVNGTISVNGGGGEVNYGGGGSGGGVYITCAAFDGTGTITANGGNGHNYGGGGSGGRIAVDYTNSTAQSNLSPSVTFSAGRGSGGANNSELGTLYFTDTTFFPSNPVSGSTGVITTPGFTNWALDSMTVTSCYLQFPAEFQMTVTNDMTIGSSGKLILSGHTTLNCGGSMIITNSGSLYVYSGMTNGGVWTNCGSLVNVTGDIMVHTNSSILPYSHNTNGGSVLFTMRNLFVATNGSISANAGGYKGGVNSDGLGPGGGDRGTFYGGGGGYGGAGGSATVGVGLGGDPYGSSNAPIDPGSGGGGSASHVYYWGGAGGGGVRIQADAEVTVNGTILANGQSGVARGAGGSGGGIYITCETFKGVGTITANGGAGPENSGGGGGGRIAIWRKRNFWQGTNIDTNSVLGGVGNGSGTDGAVGTVVLGVIPSVRTVLTFY